MGTFPWTLSSWKISDVSRAIIVVPVQPLTLLVGENSTGKTSSWRRCRRSATSIQHEEKPDFNRAPFQLGAFNEIANYRGGKAGRAKFFSLGVSLNRVGFSFRFYNEFAQPGLRDFAFEIGGRHF